MEKRTITQASTRTITADPDARVTRSALVTARTTRRRLDEMIAPASRRLACRATWAASADEMDGSKVVTMRVVTSLSEVGSAVSVGAYSWG